MYATQMAYVRLVEIRIVIQEKTVAPVLRTVDSVRNLQMQALLMPGLSAAMANVLTGKIA